MARQHNTADRQAIILLLLQYYCLFISAAAADVAAECMSMSLMIVQHLRIIRISSSRQRSSTSHNDREQATTQTHWTLTPLMLLIALLLFPVYSIQCSAVT